MYHAIIILVILIKQSKNSFLSLEVTQLMESEQKKEEEDGYFSQQEITEQIQQRTIIKLDEANPIYTKPCIQQPSFSLKLIQQSNKPDYVKSYVPFKLNNYQKQQMNTVDYGSQKITQFSFQSPFTQYYQADQLVYQKYNNQAFTKFKDARYFAGFFIPKNLIYDSIKQTSTSLHSICRQYQQKTSRKAKSSKSRQQILPQDKCQQQIQFESNFQSGNLFAAFKVGKFSYDLVMQNDINSKGSNQWFYFSVQKMLQNVQYTFNIVNFTKRDSLFNYGMKPAFFSTVGNRKLKEQWYRFGDNVSYFKGEIHRQNSTKYYYCLRFSVKTRYSQDKIYLAHSYPYTYEMLNSFSNSIMNSPDNNHIGNNMLSINGHNPNNFVSKFSIGTTISGRQIPCFKICEKNNKKKDARKVIIILARQHPGETQGSFVCEGVIKKLLQKSTNPQKDKQSDFLRKNFITYVIPMANIDGVIFGHYRTNLAGKDLNRKWDTTDREWVCPEVSAIKNFVAEIAKENQIRFILDLHGHSKKYGSFFYGNPYPEDPQFVRIYPYMCSRLNDAIQYMDCTFHSEQSKKRAARIYLSIMHKQIHVYTFQSSFYGYLKNQKIIEFTPKQYSSLGETLMQALQIQLEHEYRLQILSQPKSKNISQDIKQSIPLNFSNNTTGNPGVIVIGNPLFTKFQNQLKNDAILLGVGDQEQSGSDSNPEEGQINMAEVVADTSIATTTTTKKYIKPQQDARTCQKIPKNATIRISNKKNIVQYKDYCKPVRNVKFLALSQVNAVLPDKYHISLQPLQKKSVLKGIKIDTSCQTQINERLPIKIYKAFEIEEKNNLVGNFQATRRTSHSKRHSQLMSSIQKNQIFRVDLAMQQPLVKRRNRSERNNNKNIFTQTMISYRVVVNHNSAGKVQQKKSEKLTTQNEARIARMEQINLEVLRVYSRRSAVVDIGVKNKQKQKQKSMNAHLSARKQDSYRL